MTLLVLADLHANRGALEAVLDDAAGRWDAAVFCGDVVGYGPDPQAVIERLAGLPLLGAVRGNHDRAVLGGDDPDFSEPARRAVAWTAERLDRAARDWLAALAPGPLAVAPEILLYHGHPADEDLYLLDPPAVRSALAAGAGCIGLHGHTHLPALWWEDADASGGIGGTLAPEGSGRLPPGSAFCLNPGSVGQPRDGDPRASYVLLEPASRRVSWRRAAYDVEPVRRRVRRAGLPSWLGDRLAEGR